MTESIPDIPASIPETNEKVDQKTKISIRIEPWLNQEIEKYMTKNNLNRTDAIHAYIKALFDFKVSFETNPWGTLGKYLKEHPKQFGASSYPMGASAP